MIRNNYIYIFFYIVFYLHYITIHNPNNTYRDSCDAV